MAPNLVWFWKIGAQCVNDMKTFLEVIPKEKVSWSVWEEIFAQTEIFSGKFGEIRAKYLSSHQKFAYTYT